jgi:hypothetical protein
MFGRSMANVTVTNEASATNIYEIADEIYWINGLSRWLGP